MKRIWLNLVLLVAALGAYASECSAQPAVKVLTSANRDSDTLYRYVSNRLAITGLTRGDLVVIGSTIFRASGDTAISYYPAFPRVKFDTLRISRGKQMLFTKRFTLMALTDLVACFAGVYGNYATVKDIVDAPYLVVRFPKTGFRGNPGFVITDFNLSTSVAAGRASLRPMNGFYLDDVDLTLVRQLKKGQRVFVRDIHGRSGGSTTRSLKDIEIIIR